MPFGEEHSATLLVDVNGAPLPADVAPLLVSGYVDSARSGTARAARWSVLAVNGVSATTRFGVAACAAADALCNRPGFQDGLVPMNFPV